jgi:SSS family solute:Na+ symporter
MQFNISATDIIILFAYVAGTRLFFGWYITKKYKDATPENYFLAGRKLGWTIIGFSFYVSNMSGSTFVGLPGSGYKYGIAVYNYEWLPAVILIFFIAFILPYFFKSGTYTAPGFLEKRFDKRSKITFSVFLLFANIFIDAAAALYAGGMIFKVIFPDVQLWLIILLLSLTAGIYIYFGGLDAVVLNDALQAIMIFLGGILITYFAWQKIPSWDALTSSIPEKSLHLIQSVNDDFLPWPGIFSGVLIIGIYFWCTNQFIIQRALAARDLNEGRRGALFAGFLKLPNLFILIIPGLIALYLYPDIERADMVFPALAFNLLPEGLKGLMLAALAAAILSSLESIYNSASTLFTMDIIANFRSAAKDKYLVKTGRISTIAFMILSAAWAPQIERFPTLWEYLQSILSYITPPIAALFIMAVFWKKLLRQQRFIPC